MRFEIDAKYSLLSAGFTTLEPCLRVTSLIRSPRHYGPLFLSQRNARTFSHKKTPLMRPSRRYGQRPHSEIPPRYIPL